MEYNITYRKKDKGIQAIITYKNNSGEWKQKSKQGFKTQKEAKPFILKMVKNIEYELLNEKNIISDDYNLIVLKDLFKLFVDHMKIYRTQNTIESYETSFCKFYKLHNLKVSEIKKIHIQACVDDFTLSGLKASSIETYVKKLKQLFIYYKDNYDNSYTIPTENITFSKKTTPDKKALTLEDTEKMLKDFKENHFQYYPFVLLCVRCGLRRGEALGVTYSDLNKKDKIITIDKQWKKLKTGVWGFGETKNRKHRTVPVSVSLIKELEYVKNNSKTIDINNRIVSHSGVFISQYVNKYLKPYGITIHELRHTYITNLVYAGVDFKTIADLVGDTVRMIYDTYSHVNDDMLKKAIGVIEKIY